jgi:putative nucleotidyltransferase with HDIG domain
VIKKDQALTSKVLKIVNSAYYGFYRQIGNIDQAIVILGFNEVKNITIATSLIQTFHWNISQRINREKFWIHSLGCALIARSLCLAKLELNPEDAFVAGLLHDVGKIILYQYFPENYNTVLRIAQKQRRPLFEVCRDLMEIDHAEVGGMVAESWKFPPTLVNAIQFHHKPENAAPEDYYIHLTHLANYFCHNEEIGESGTPKVQEPFSGSMEALDIKERRLNRILTSFKLDNEFISNLI